MKKLFVVLAAMVLTTTAIGSPALAAVEVTGDAYVGYFSKYVWRGFDLSGGMPVFQGGVDLSAEGFTLSYWTNVATRNDDVNNDGILSSADGDFEGGEGTENDLILNYAIPVGETATINVGNIYYMLDGYDDTNEVYAGATLNTLLSPTVKIFYDWDKADENGLYYTAAVSHSLPVGEMITLGASALVGYNDENYSVSEEWSDWHNYELSAKADIKVTEQLTITPSILYSSPISDDAKDKIDSQLVGGVNVLFAF
jgi:uncharacterized protein (TIGR02001 family)